MKKEPKSTASIEDGILNNALFLSSPNCSDRSEDSLIDLLIIHNISLPPGEYGTKCVQKLFCNELDFQAHEYFKTIDGLKVSSHLLIERDGNLVQFVPLHKKAWHAGASEFAGRKNCNDFSIGIELEGTDDEEFTDEQYSRLIEVSRVILDNYSNINVDRIVGHSDIAPGRKTDPGPFFDWNRYKLSLVPKPNDF